MTIGQIPATDARAAVDAARHTAWMYRDVNLSSDNPAYRLAGERARVAGEKYGAHAIELCAVMPTEEIS